MAYYTKEQIDKANKVDLEEYLRFRGEHLKQTGSESRLIYRDSTGEHDSISVRGNRWYDHKNQNGGYTVKFLQEFYGLTFKEAMQELLNGEIPEHRKDETTNLLLKKPKAKFQLPEKADNMKRLFAYLTKTRFLSADVVKFFVEQKLLYQEKTHNNIVFVGIDKNATPRYASEKSAAGGGFKMTVTGSDAQYGFCWRGGGQHLFVFEAAVDLLSYITLYPEEWQKENYIALDGVSPKPLLKFVEDHKETIMDVHICTDYDPAGIEAAEKLMDLLLAAGYSMEQLHRKYPLYKDWNEQLKTENNVEPILPQAHPKKVTYHKIVHRLGIMNAKTEEPYMKWKENGFAKKGIIFYIDTIKKEFEQVQKEAENKREDTLKKLEASLLRMVDLSVDLMCVIENQQELPKLTAYQNTVMELEKEYKAYLDHSKMKARFNTLQKEISCLEKALQKDSQSLFLCLKKVADLSIKATVYIKTDYPMELERRNSILDARKNEFEKLDMR